MTSTGRGTYRRTAPDRYGFPPLTLRRTKQHFGYATGDLVRANAPTGKKQGSRKGRVASALPATSTSRLSTASSRAFTTGTSDLLQRADGYAYTPRTEASCA
ncbi:hypothetical protein [Streptomyces sp. NPDC048825]|uniref:hypothetical protein n=1 Tax=Streptomyces sp. NPDC048825 TaxID=3365592 RepID=UPI0037147B2F